ncbi:MAG TPA: hypothetical protein VJP89_12460 [Pyrinomonadaceae bacterium]|nr:hypothetical protein [Pyrinomonadaceae bacterium]
MRQETNNEIDLLLRRMSRQDGGSVRESTEQHLGQHLDGDELSSYAQNALPAAARARYTEHLADCSTCRKLVTELSLSLGSTAAAAAPVETISEPSALKKFLASLFSPMVMRYAVPALGLIVVAAIGFVILRDRSQNGFVAQLDTKQNQAAPITATPETPASASSPNMAFDDSGQKQSGQTAPPVTNPKETAPPGGILAGDTAAGPAPAPAPTPASERAEAAAPASQPSVAAAEPPSAKTGFLADGEEKKKNEEKKKTEDQKKTDVAKKESAPATVQSTDTSVATAKANEPARDENRAPKPADQRVDESKRESLPVQGRTTTLGGVANVARARKQAEKDKDDAETRTVSGRRFRKERGIWTDTAYDSSTRTVDMGRGSEQFRALVADEPEIKKIAEQLDGEVIVVWKGRAYRIR